MEMTLTHKQLLEEVMGDYDDLGPCQKLQYQALCDPDYSPHAVRRSTFDPVKAFRELARMPIRNPRTSHVGR